MEGTSYRSVMDIMKGLEALKNISWQFDLSEKAQDEYKIVEKELKAFEIVRRNKKILSLYKKWAEEIYSEEEIKEYGGQKYILADGSNQYIECEISKEDYDLLKEVLTNE